NTIKEGNETPTLTEKELVVMIDEIEGEGTLEKTESELIKSAIEFDDKPVSEILVPRVDIVAVDKSISIEDMKHLFLSSGFSRIPVFDGTIDRVIGVIYAKDFYNRYFEGSNASIEDIIRPVKFIPETTTVARALSEIQKSMVQMVIVVDAYGGTVGIVSLEDVLEELVGEIWDESDEVQYSIVRDPDGSYLALGEANIYDMMKEIGIEFDTGRYEGHTVGGYIQYKLNRVPIKGDRLNEGEITMIVRTTKNRRIKLVQVIPKKEPESSVESP
ncbi:MAG: hemolysin family protein, partial [Candidatus Methanomethylophilaceae archaeon]